MKMKSDYFVILLNRIVPFFLLAAILGCASPEPTRSDRSSHPQSLPQYWVLDMNKFKEMKFVGEMRENPEGIIGTWENLNKFANVDTERRKAILNFLFSRLSSTGEVQLIGTYPYKMSGFSEEGQTVFHFIQQDLFGGRLFYSYLINLESGEFLCLYDCNQESKKGVWNKKALKLKEAG